MATKSYSKHKEYKEYSTSGTVPYTDEQFDMLKSDLIPKGSKLNSLGRTGAGTREYHYEYKEEMLPSGKYDRKDLHTVDEYTIPPKALPKSSDSNAYYYEREERELPALASSGTRTYNYETNSSSTPGYSKVKSSKVTKELTQNVEELDSLLDDLQKDQERQLYKSGYTSDTAESTSFDFRKGTPVRPAPSSGYSTLKREERLESGSWVTAPAPAPAPAPTARSVELRQEVYREEKESRVVPPQISPAAPPAGCAHCRHPPATATLSRCSTPMNKVTTTVKTYTYEVPADQDPTTVPLPNLADHQHTYVSSSENLRTASNTLQRAASPPPPAGGCQYCSHCNSHIREYRTVTTTDVTDETNERMVYPAPGDAPALAPAPAPAPAPAHPHHHAPAHPHTHAHTHTHTLPQPQPHNGHGPYGPTTYKYSETSYSTHNTNATQRFPVSPQLPAAGPPPLPRRAPSPSPSPSPGPFPRSTTPSPGNQQPPKKLDDLMADFPEARFPSQPDGVVRRKAEVTHEESRQRDAPKPGPGPVVGGSRNVAGPAVYYPPGHTPFAKKDAPLVGAAGYQASAMQGGGAYASGRGMYEYESGSRSKEKHYEKKTAVPICLPLCCAMPCVIM